MAQVRIKVEGDKGSYTASTIGKVAKGDGRREAVSTTGKTATQAERKLKRALTRLGHIAHRV
jgi:hypothetical protein